MNEESSSSEPTVEDIAPTSRRDKSFVKVLADWLGGRNGETARDALEELIEDSEEGEESEEAEDTDLDLGLEEADYTDEEVDDSGFDLGGDSEDTVEGEDEEEVEDIYLGDDSEEDAVEDEGQKIRVSAEQAEELVKYLEEKGVDVEEMFGGSIEVEDGDEGGDDLDLDLEGGEGEGEGEISDEEMELDLDLGGEGEGEGDGLDLEGEVDDVEEGLTGFTGTKHEDETNNLIKGAKQVVINYK
mgnify:CR=1 FL=1